MRTILFFLCAEAGLAQLTHIEVNPKAAPPRRVCVMPADAKMVKIGFKGGETMTEESEDWAGKLRAALRRAVVEGGGEVTGDLSPELLEKDAASREAAVRLRQKYDGIARQMFKKRGGVNKGRFTLGDEVAIQPCAAEADALLFLDAYAQLQTGGRKTFSVITGGVLGPMMAMSQYRVDVGFVGAKSGEMIAAFDFSAMGGKAGSDPEEALHTRMAERFKKVFGGPSAK